MEKNSISPVDSNTWLRGILCAAVFKERVAYAQWTFIQLPLGTGTLVTLVDFSQ